MNKLANKWRETEETNFQKRVLIKGNIIRSYGIFGDHEHFSIKTGSKNGDHLEVIFNTKFGYLPKLTPGLPVVACGDFIKVKVGPPGKGRSPDGAIVHWVHRNPDKKPGDAKHDHGYLSINEQLYGFH